MSNVAVIFAGGTGQRMNTRTRPKQFLELHGKPIIIYTLEEFEHHAEIDGIIVVMLESWIAYTQDLISKYNLKKVKKVVPGGASGQDSIYNGLCAAAQFYGDDDIVLIHDGVRPLVDEETITANIRGVEERGTAITVTAAIETITMKDETGAVGTIIDRSQCELARAPQSFRLGQILGVHNKMRQDPEAEKSFIDSASLMKHYGYKLYTVQGKPENIKITTPSDYYIFRAMIDARENSSQGLRRSAANLEIASENSPSRNSPRVSSRKALRYEGKNDRKISDIQRGFGMDLRCGPSLGETHRQ